MEELTSNILKNFNNISLDELAEDLPTTLTSDAHLMKAEEFYSEQKPWKAFHHLSLSHSTLMYHRLLHKLNRSQNLKNASTLSVSEENLCKNFTQKVSLNQLPNYDNILRPPTCEETKNNLQLLPQDWTVVQITSGNKLSGSERIWKKIDEPLSTPVLYISRCRCGPNPSIIIKKVRPPKEETSVRSILEEMELIKGINKVISKYYKSDPEKYFSKREEVNNRLRVLVRSMENSWLRFFSCLLVGSLPSHQEIQIEKRIKEVAKKLRLSLSGEQITLLMLMVSYPFPTATAKDSVVFDFPLRAGIGFVLEESIRSIKVKNLSTALTDLQEEVKDLRNATRNPVILVMDKCVVSLPWEMMVPLRNQSVTRMPSLHSLIYLYLQHSQKADSLLTKGIDPTKGFYILDPDNNLPRSQERLEETFASTNWEGVKGQRPSHDQFKEALTSKDVFVYVGHGSGSQYMPAHLVEIVECRSLVFLYGCSSAALSKRGAVPDPWGVILNYLIASCPCVVGMLWEVMDRDTDLLTKEMIRGIRGLNGEPGSPLEDPPTDLALLVAKARPLCSWYLISAALVVYGLPLHVVSHSENDAL